MTKPFYKVISTDLDDVSEAQRDSSIFYRCEICGEYVPSQPKDNVKCNCGNIVIDTEYVRLFVKDFSKFTVVQQTG